MRLLPASTGAGVSQVLSAFAGGEGGVRQGDPVDLFAELPALDAGTGSALCRRHCRDGGAEGLASADKHYQLRTRQNSDRDAGASGISTGGRCVSAAV